NIIGIFKFADVEVRRGPERGPQGHHDFVLVIQGGFQIADHRTGGESLSSKSSSNPWCGMTSSSVIMLRPAPGSIPMISPSSSSTSSGNPRIDRMRDKSGPARTTLA